MAEAPERTFKAGLDRYLPPLLLGLNAWAVALFVPYVLEQDAASTSLPVLLLPLAPLLGAIPLLRDENPLGVWVLLAAFPVALAVGLGVGAIDMPGPAHRVLSALSLAAFLVSANQRLGTRVRLREVGRRPLPASDEAWDARLRKLLRLVVLLVAASGAFALVVIAPIQPAEALASAWGEAHGAAATLLGTVGTVLGVTVLAVFVAPSFRRSRARPPSSEQVQLRVAALLLLVLAGAFTWYVVESGGPPRNMFGGTTAAATAQA